MEKVIVVKRIPGILEIGDVLTSDEFGHDFILEQKSSDRYSSRERYVNLDYYTVSGNIPEYFEFIVDEDEPSIREFKVIRDNHELFRRYSYFIERMNKADLDSDQAAIYQNLIWFIDWLTGTKELIRA